MATNLVRQLYHRTKSIVAGGVGVATGIAVGRHAKLRAAAATTKASTSKAKAVARRGVKTAKARQKTFKSKMKSRFTKVKANVRTKPGQARPHNPNSPF